MLSYWKNGNMLRQIESNDTPYLLQKTIDSEEWKEITKEEYESLCPKDEYSKTLNNEIKEPIEELPIEAAPEEVQTAPIDEKDTTEERYF